jgi:DNA-binding response OmpR family regulator
MKILVVDDDDGIRSSIKASLEAECYSVDVLGDGDRGFYQAKTNDYDLVVLDDILPGKHGAEICRELRSCGKMMPILLISGKSDVDRRVMLLNDGADDYVTKPFSFVEFNARVRALLRRPPAACGTVLCVGDLTLDTVGYFARRGKSKITLTSKEFSLLEYLMRHAGSVVLHQTLLEHTWDSGADQCSNAIATHIGNLRRKIDFPGRPTLIRTVPGRGYFMED